MGKFFPHNPMDFPLFFGLLDLNSEDDAAQSCPKVKTMSIFRFYLGASLTVLNSDFTGVIRQSELKHFRVFVASF
mgnify:CR=1 FL=1